MIILKQFVGGALGAAIGGGIWFVAASWMDAPLSWLACLVGLTAGAGVRTATAESDRGIRAGLLAVAVAAATKVVAKYGILVSAPVLDEETRAILDSAYESSLDDESMIAKTADQIVLEREAAGQSVDWPEDITFEEAVFEDDYPPDLWLEARERWEHMSREEQDDQRNEHESEVRAVIHSMERNVAQRRFLESFAAQDVLWFFIAAFAAFRPPAGRVSEL